MANVNDIIADLVNAFDEYSDDSVSLTAILEMYIDQINMDGEIDDKEQFLTALLGLMKDHPDVVARISWDFPKEILKFLTTANVDVTKRLGYSVIISLVMKCFNEIAFSAEPKECLLTGCELLSNLSLENENIELEMEQGDHTNSKGQTHYSSAEIGKYHAERTPADFFVSVKMYILFELIGTTLQRIPTLNPSKYLGLATSAMIRFIKANCDGINDVRIVMRRIFSFCRNYVPPDTSLCAVSYTHLDVYKRQMLGWCYI